MEMLQNISKKKDRLFFACLVIILLFAFWFNPATEILDQTQPNYDQYSNDIMVADLMYNQNYPSDSYFLHNLNPDMLSQKNVSPDYLGFIIKNEFLKNKVFPQDYFGAYTSNLTLHRYLYRLMDLVLPVSNSGLLKIIEFMNCFLLSICIAIILMWIKKRTNGFVAAVILFFLAFLAPTFSMMGKNLYWASWSLFVPMVSMILLHSSKRYINAKTKNKFWLLGAVACISCFIKQSCYFEYVSTSMVAMMIPVIYETLQSRVDMREKVKYLLFPVIGAFVSFFAVNVIKIILLSMQFGGIQNAMSIITANLNDRLIGNLNAENPLILQSAKAGYFQVLSTMNQKTAFTISSVFSISQYFLIIASLIITAVEFLKHIKAPKTFLSDQSFPLTACVWVSLLGPYSWFIIAKPHTYIHHELSVIIWFIPFSILALAYILRFIVTAVSFSLETIPKVKKAVITLLTIFIICVSMISPQMVLRFEQWKENERVLQNAMIQGDILVNTQDRMVLYYGDTLYYVDYKKPNIDLPYFIRTKSASDDSENSVTFQYKYQKLLLPYWNDCRVSSYYIPSSNLVQISTGQYDEDGVIWSGEIEMQ